ncbi:MAG: hypothetical protein LUO88_01915 [Methanoregulaceae archaeon]|nr:hypothetical protein [Methanoregulaceae archaeon]
MKIVVITAFCIAVLLVGCSVFPGTAASSQPQAQTIQPAASGTTLDPAASSVELLSISYWRNGIRQPDIPMKEKFCETLFVSHGDHVMLKINGMYKGPRGTKGYMILREPIKFTGQDIQYKWMNPGAKTSMLVTKPYRFPDYGEYVFLVDLYGPGQSVSDGNILTINVA